MTEARVGFLYKIASQLSNSNTNPTATYLRNFYLMRCHDITRSYGLPTQQFSPNLRCSNCCQEWKHGNYETKITSTKLSKKLRRKLRSYKVTEKNKEHVKRRQDMLCSNQLERTCHLCKHTTTISMTKPVKTVVKIISGEKIGKVNKVAQNFHSVQSSKETLKLNTEKMAKVNVYTSTKDVFSLKNKANILTSNVKDTLKVIKNNKRKKDKFAGLCKEAVLASAKLTKVKSNKNKLDLFLKPLL